MKQYHNLHLKKPEVRMDNEEKTEGEIYDKLARLCSKSEQCSPDIKKKIISFGGTSLTAEKIISRLEKEDFLNDERYVRSYVSEKFRINRWGRIKIHYYLKMKGLDENKISRVMAEIDNNEYIRLLIKTMKEKAKTIKGCGNYEKMGHIIRFAQSRGFEPELIHRHLPEVMS